MKRWIMVVSAVAFFCLQITTKVYAVGLIPAVVVLIWFAVKRPNFAAVPEMHWAGNVFCALTAAGICLWPIEGFAGWLRSITVFQTLQGFLRADSIGLSKIASYGFAGAGIFFVYQMMRFFYTRFFRILREMIRDCSREERTVAVAATVVLMTAVVLVYLRTDAFASPLVLRDLVYTADSGAIVHQNAYLSISALENDFRSPLFALFAAPLMGLAYLISCILPIPNALALVITAAQVPLLVVSFCLLAKLIRDLPRFAKLILPVFLLSTYSALLFTLMVEQYVIALFYLSAGLYSLLMYGKRDQMLILGAAGTMIPAAAMALIPEHENKTFESVVKDTVRTALTGFVLLCAMGSFSVLLRIPETLQNISRFTGTNITFGQKILQYFAFVEQIFMAPQASALTAPDGYVKWQLLEIHTFSIPGAVLLGLACAGFLLNRKQRFAQISMAWIIVSFLMLCVLGWGTAENGLTLYTLYFGWAFAVLLVYLVEKGLQIAKMERYSWIVYLLCTVGLLWYNLPQIQALVQFAITHYPLQGGM